MTDYPMLIDGTLVAGDRTLDVINPATGEPFTTVARASEAQMLEAIAAAKAAQKGWAATPLAERRAALLKLADHIEANLDAIARTLVIEQGKPLAEATMEVGYAPAFIR